MKHLLALLLVLTCTRPVKADANVVFVILDQIPAWITDPAQRAPLDLPALDSLAARGRVFTRAYSTSPVCSANRVALLAGRYPFYGTNKLDGSEATLGTILQVSGWDTGFVGKWHLSPAATPSGYVDPSVRPGWRYFAGNEGAPHDYTTGFAFINNDPAPISTAPWEPSWMTQQAVRFIRAERSSPYALVVSYGVPHPAKGSQGYTPPQTYYTPNQITPRPNVDQADKLAHKQRVAAYMGLCVTADNELGVLLAEIDLNTTFVVLTSDHGDNLYAHGTGPSQQKRRPWEESTHVPLLVAGPGISLGTDPRLMASVDLLPSVLSLLGVSAPESVQGRAFPFTRAVYLGHNQDQNSWGGEKWRGLVDGNQKYATTQSGSLEVLFNLRADPHELNNLADNPAYQPSVGAMRAALAARGASIGDPFTR